MTRACVVTGSPLTEKRPAAPGPPPKIPSGATARRLVTAFSCHGRVVSTENSIVWPSPPGCVPAPPDPGRSCLQWKRMGALASTTSTGTAATPVGYEQADSPGLAARAPTPPAYVNIAVMNGRPSSSWPLTCMVHTAPEPSAMAWSGLTWASALRSALGRNIPTTWRAVPGWGETALTMLPSGASTLMGARLPWLFGISGLSTLRTAKVV